MQGLTTTRSALCWGFASAILLSSCATRPVRPLLAIPEPRLSPASLGQTISVAQRLSFERRHRTPEEPARSLDAQLEVDARELRLADIAMGTRVLTLSWDGQQLQQQRHPQLPAQVDAARVLRDIQYAYWPADAIRRVLPEGWSLQEADQQRELRSGDTVVLSLRYRGQSLWDGYLQLDNLVEGYRLDIQSSVQDAATPR